MRTNAHTKMWTEITEVPAGCVRSGTCNVKIRLPNTRIQTDAKAIFSFHKIPSGSYAS